MSTNIREATHQYEQWLAQRMSLVRRDLQHKHTLMRQDAFSFFRATFYRWSQLWPEVCADAAAAPVVLAVGDLHVENFGTWRDQEGRLIWGINDFDEAYRLPYTQDLIRLAVSANIAIEEAQLGLKPKEACDAILAGYLDGVRSGGEPFVLSERHVWLRDLATNSLRDPVRYWQSMKHLPPVKGAIPRQVQDVLRASMPTPGLTVSLRHRVSGLGSLGRPRYIALAEWQGGTIAREAKALAPSAWVWVRDGRGDSVILYQSIVDQAVHCRDPFLRVHGNWLIRRLSPYCSRIELALLPKKYDEGRLLYAMGFETANVHLGTPRMQPVLRRDLANRKAKWLRLAMKAMTHATMSDWREWRSSTAES